MSSLESKLLIILPPREQRAQAAACLNDNGKTVKDLRLLPQGCIARKLYVLHLKLG